MFGVSLSSSTPSSEIPDDSEGGGNPQDDSQQQQFEDVNIDEDDDDSTFEVAALLQRPLLGLGGPTTAASPGVVASSSSSSMLPATKSSTAATPAPSASSPPKATSLFRSRKSSSSSKLAASKTKKQHRDKKNRSEQQPTGTCTKKPPPKPTASNSSSLPSSMYALQHYNNSTTDLSVSGNGTSGGGITDLSSAGAITTTTTTTTGSCAGTALSVSTNAAPDNDNSNNNNDVNVVGSGSDHIVNMPNFLPRCRSCMRRSWRWYQGSCNRLWVSKKSTLKCMNVIAKLVLWWTIIGLVAAVFWYSYELSNHGADPHLIAWFSAGAFVILGFPISMWGIIGHLANFNQPRVQQYIVRILWMVPIYSIESWLAMRFHKQAIYIETARDFYESYVLYSFLQFLIEVLGGEESLILMLKDKSPTRGFHMWGLQWCVKPWLMGQPVRKLYNSNNNHSVGGGIGDAVQGGGGSATIASAVALAAGGAGVGPGSPAAATSSSSSSSSAAVKRVHWTSPFFVKCKFGVLQYVLLKFLCAVAVLVLEWKGWYSEGHFTWSSGYLYICILTNLSQCWALYCLIFFYYATHTELSPIRPVGKFLSVKALVFFTWWQSVVIAILYQMDVFHTYMTKDNVWQAEDVAKGIQDYLICIEMFLAAVVHIFVFPHSEYSPKAVEARTRALNHQAPMKNRRRLLGRNNIHSKYNLWVGARDDVSKSSANAGLEMTSLDDSLNGLDGSLPSSSPPSRSSQLHNNDLEVGSDNDNDDGRRDHHRQRLRTTSSIEEDDGGGGGARYLSPVEDTDDEDILDESSHRAGDGGGGSSNNAAAVFIHRTDTIDDEDGGGGLISGVGSGIAALDDSSDDDTQGTSQTRTGFVRAFIDSTIPRDLRDNTVGIVTGEYSVEKKTLLHHAATSDQYDLFSPNRRPFRRKNET